jgi:hypothetical protein
VPFIFGNAKTKGTDKVNNARQYQSTMTFELTAVRKKLCRQLVEMQSQKMLCLLKQ